VVRGIFRSLNGLGGTGRIGACPWPEI